MKKIIIPESVVLVKTGAFSGCYKLADVTFLSDSVEIQEDAFELEYELKEKNSHHQQGNWDDV